MIPGFGKEQISLGSAPNNDVVLQGPGVAPNHARIVRQGNALQFIDNGAAPSYANGAPVQPNAPMPFDFRTQFALGQTQVPLSHPAIVMMTMAKGNAAAPPGHLLVGREAANASLVIHSSAVSATHATVMMDRMMVQDSGSTSGTYVGGQRIPANQPVPMDPNGVVAFGPIPVSVSLLGQIAQAFHGGGAPVAHGSQPNMIAGAPAMPGGPQGAPPPAGGPPAHRKHRTVIGELNLSELQGGTITIGRTPDNKIVVPHPQVSSKHAQIIDQGGSLFLEDLGSGNGTFVRGQRIPRGQRVPVANGEKVFIGPMPLVIQISGKQINVAIEDLAAQQASWAGKPLYEIEAWDLFLQVPDRDNPAEMKTLLDHVSFKALPGDMIALMGPSGAGKTTLLMTLNGYLPPTSGQVRINGEDLYAIYDALRGVIGYVPQDDIVHPELTVFEAVKYSARFRLPNDYSEQEIDARVDQTLRDLGLEAQKHLQIGKPEKKVLSGGQRKRVNIALELVTDPVILFLDEPTSGLASDDTTALINLLHDLTKKTGKTIIMTIHQPAKDEYEKFNLAFIMGYGGIPVYYGRTASQSYGFFSGIIRNPQYAGVPTLQNRAIDNPRDMFDMLNVRERVVHERMKQQNPNVPRPLARLEAAREWRAEFLNPQNPVFQEMYSGRRAVGTEPAARGVPHRPSVAQFAQLMLLMSRYWKVKIRDRAGAAIMFLQAPIIGVMLAFVFAGQQKAVPFWCLGALQELGKRMPATGQNSADLLSRMQPTEDHTAAVFFVIVSAVWFGTSNSAREIVTERAIYMRERMVNLGLFNYVFSKFIILSMICVLQCTILLGIVFFTLGFHGGIGAFLLELAVTIMVAINATALGLLLSTGVDSAEAAMSLTPIALIPQVVLGGLMVPMTTNPMLKPLMYVMPARWGFEGSITHERVAIMMDPAWLINLQNPTLNDPSNYVVGGFFQCAVAQVGSGQLQGAWGFTNYLDIWMPSTILFAMTVLMVGILLVLLKRRDPV